jgi:hypothetical protein
MRGVFLRNISGVPDKAIGTFESCVSLLNNVSVRSSSSFISVIIQQPIGQLRSKQKQKT